MPYRPAGKVRNAPPSRPRRIPVAVALLACALAAGCGHPRGAAPDPPRAVILIVIDTLSPDHLGSYGDTRATTPTLDSLAAAGVRFTDAMTTVPVTLPAVTSLLTGRLPPHHGVRDNDRFVLDPAEETLAERFQAAGWRTGAVLGSAILARDRGLAQGFDTYDDTFADPFPVYDPTLLPLAGELSKSQRRADVVTNRALTLVKTFGPAPYFLFVHYFDAHMFYDPPPGHAALHPGRPYDGEISFVDAEIGRLLRGLGPRRDALVVVVSDHGEANGDHGEPQHGFLLYQATLRVAALASGAGVPAGVVRHDLVSLVDLEPTLARACRLPHSARPRDGRALAWGRPEARPPFEYAETLRPLIAYNWSELRAIRSDRYKLVEGAGRRELYDLEADPHERAPLEAPNITADLARELRRFAAGDDAEAVYRAANGQGDSPRSEMLEGLGYIGRGVAEERPAPHRPHPLDALPRWVATQNAKTFFKRAYAALMTGDAGAALGLLNRSLALDSTLTDALYLRGYARKLTGDRRAALADFDACLRLKPDFTGARAQRKELEAPGRPPAVSRAARRGEPTAPPPESFDEGGTDAGFGEHR